MLRPIWRVALLVAPVLALVAIACGSGQKDRLQAITPTSSGPPAPTSTATPTATPTPAAQVTPTPTAAATPTPGTPFLQIVTPSTGTPVAQGDLRVEALVLSFNIVDKLGQPNVPGEGHVHFYLLQVGDAVPTTPGQPAFTAQGTYQAQASTSYTWADVQPGIYKVAVQVVNNDHTPLTPPAVQAVLVEVQ